MVNNDLNKILALVKNAKRSYRDEAAEAVINTPEILPDLVDKVFDTEDPLHIKAAWILELVCLHDCSLLNDHIVRFINGMSELTHESALRPVSKICSIWCTYYFSNESAVKRLNKKEIAYKLANSIESDNTIVIDQNDEAIKYLINAIKYACND